MISRRELLIGSAAAAGALIAPPAWAENGFPSRRWVKIVFVNTGERFNDLYFWDDAYIFPAVKQFSWTCRDHRANEWKWIHPWLMDLLFVLHWKYNKDEIKILSGYRTAETAALPENPQQLENLAANSQHMRAMALDVHVPDVDNVAVAGDVKTFIYGGVGMYPGHGFVHCDFGPMRSWVGPPGPAIASKVEIPLEPTGGVFAVPVIVNRAIRIPFVLDSGAADVQLPAEVFSTLIRTGTLSEADFIGTGLYDMADGSAHRSLRFNIREMRVGEHVVRNVTASVGAVALLGQSFLKKVPFWTLDNRRHVLILER